MPEKWTGALIGEMHNNKITYEDLAKEMGVSTAYISMLLNGARKPKEIRQRMEAAYAAVIRRRKDEKEEKAQR